MTKATEVERTPPRRLASIIRLSRPSGLAGLTIAGRRQAPAMVAIVGGAGSFRGGHSSASMKAALLLISH